MGRKTATMRGPKFLRDYDGSVIQMWVAYNVVTHFLLHCTDCKAQAHGRVRPPEDYAIQDIVFPSLLHLLSGITELDDMKQRKLCLKKFRSRDEHLSEVDTKWELECGLCMLCFEY
ncbi:hypothetical protein Zm00014a_039882 [Zea mays]|uniref:Uncharacterized protein n=2 Tax=Zea mays TaxID=4577 RepID=A0A8J8YAK8_MAIZE|nr:hypothetical protein ZEAMMB73_Zm00001d044492 [Zea mays]PWZ31685.1 hypothetical protein Zm00014a_039882 [Zea mays]